jgi:hypothetical protein
MNSVVPVISPRGVGIDIDLRGPAEAASPRGRRRCWFCCCGSAKQLNTKAITVRRASADLSIAARDTTSFEDNVRDEMGDAFASVNSDVDDESFCNALCKAFGFRRLHVPGDGNCLFSCIALAMYGSLSNSKSVRSGTVEHLRKNKSQFAAFATCDFDTYLRTMARSGSWGGELELRAISELYKVAVRIYSNGLKPFTINEGCNRAILLWRGGNHYDLLISEQAALSPRGRRSIEESVAD